MKQEKNTIVIVIPHHGSNDANCQKRIDDSYPGAVLGVCSANSEIYGQPNSAVRGNYAVANIILITTEKSGNCYLTLRGKGETYIQTDENIKRLTEELIQVLQDNEDRISMRIYKNLYILEKNKTANPNFDFLYSASSIPVAATEIKKIIPIIEELTDKIPLVEGCLIQRFNTNIGGLKQKLFPLEEETNNRDRK